jgi:hypothetical protein
MLALMRNPQVPLDERIELAAKAAPFVHARPRPVPKDRPEDLKFASLAAKPNGGEGADQRPLDFLLGVMADSAASPRQRVKAAAVAARYKHAYANTPEAPSLLVVEDEFGFTVDPELARAERDDRLRERRLGGAAGKPELEQIRKRREERVALVKFPEGYTYGHRAADRQRLQELDNKRCSGKELTPEEEAEELHLAVRVLNPAAGKRIITIIDWRPTKEETLTRMKELETRRLNGEMLSAAEEDELQDVRRQHPDYSAELSSNGKLFLVKRVVMSE